MEMIGVESMITSFGDMDQASARLVKDPMTSEDEIRRAMEETILEFDRMVEIASVLKSPS